MSRIGFDISDLHAGHADGTTRFTYELARRFPELAAKHTWLYFSSGQPATQYCLSSKAPTPIISPWPKFWTQLRFPLDLYRHRPDVLFMPIQQLPYVRPRKLKTVCVVHDVAWHQYPEYFTYKDWLLQHVFTAYAVQHADHLIAVSQATADDITKYYGRSDDISVVHHGVDHDRFRVPQVAEKAAGWQALQQWHPKLRQPYILYVGQIQPRKNLVRLIEAFETLKQTETGFKDTQLVLAGSHGWLNAPIYERAKTSSVASDIVMPGRVPEELLPALYWNAEVFVLPSLYEGFGLPLIEAMASGTPVVTSNTSSMVEIAEQAAVVINPLDVSELAHGIVQAKAQKSDLQTAGVARAQSFTWDNTTEKILAILKTI